MTEVRTCAHGPPLRRGATLGPAAADDARPAGERGQAAVEFALVLPVIVVMCLSLVAVGIAVRNELAVELAAREGARAAAVSASPAAAATAAAHRAVDLPIDIVVSENGATVTVVATYTDPTDIALIGRFIGPVEHRASVTMTIEPPDP